LRESDGGWDGEPLRPGLIFEHGIPNDPVFVVEGPKVAEEGLGGTNRGQDPTEDELASQVRVEGGID
jgi:hypothetical protein